MSVTENDLYRLGKQLLEDRLAQEERSQKFFSEMFGTTKTLRELTEEKWKQVVINDLPLGHPLGESH